MPSSMPGGHPCLPHEPSDCSKKDTGSPACPAGCHPLPGMAVRGMRQALRKSLQQRSSQSDSRPDTHCPSGTPCGLLAARRHPAARCSKRRKIAVLGRNTTGLAAAYFLCRLGHGVTIMGNEKEFEESCASAEARDALERVQRYLSDCGAVFAEPIPAPETASAGFDAVIFCSGMDKAEHAISGERKGGSSGISLPGVAGRHSLLVSCGSGREAPLFVLTEKSSSPAAATAAARLAASAADTVLGRLLSGKAGMAPHSVRRNGGARNAARQHAGRPEARHNRQS